MIPRIIDRIILHRIYMTQTVSRSLNKSRQRPLESVYLLRRSLASGECNERKSPPFSSSHLMGQNSIDRTARNVLCTEKQVLTPKILTLQMLKCHGRRRHLFHEFIILMHSFPSNSLNDLGRTNKSSSRVQGWF